jgi:hypothetical protein
MSCEDPLAEVTRAVKNSFTWCGLATKHDKALRCDEALIHRSTAYKRRHASYACVLHVLCVPGQGVILAQQVCQPAVVLDVRSGKPDLTRPWRLAPRMQPAWEIHVVT